METQIEKDMEQRQVLTNLMAGGYLEPAHFDKESNALAAEAETLVPFLRRAGHGAFEDGGNL